MKIDCPHCGAHYDISPDCIGESAQCTECGNKFNVENPNLAPCPDCFSLISKRANTCPKCEAPLNIAANKTESQVSNSKSPDNEVNIAVLHPLPMAYFWHIILGIVTIPFALVGLFYLIWIVIEIKCTTYLLTNKRVVIQKGWISQKRDEIWICDMRGVNMFQGVWQRIINVGNVAIGTAATGSHEIVITNIEEPQKLVATVNSLRAKYK